MDPSTGRSSLNSETVSLPDPEQLDALSADERRKVVASHGHLPDDRKYYETRSLKGKEDPGIPAPGKPPLNSVVEEIEVLLSLTFFALAGCTARNGLDRLTAFESLGSVWGNFTGCFVIAFIPSAFGPILAGTIGTGFCGALTSFSELITDIFMESTSPKENWPDYGYGVPLFMARLLLELSCCFGGYLSGTHFGKAWTSLGLRHLPDPYELAVRRVTEILGILGWVACLVTSITSPNHVRWWAMSGIFSPFGVWARYYLSRLNNTSANATFKWGTFAANVSGTLVACVTQTCLLFPWIHPVQYQVVSAIQHGFCGCLTTISTFIKELNSMSLVRAYFYAVVSLFVGYSLSFIIIGSYKWTR